MEQQRIGIIGYGGFGQFLRKAWDEMKGVEVCAVADADEARDPGDVTFYHDWRGLLADEHVDLVSVATPPFLHAEMAIEALDAGKHVLVEKPIALTLAEAEAIGQAAERSGCVVAIDYMLRFNPIVEAVHDWCRRGVFGRLQRVVVENYAQDEALPRTHWFWDEQLSGGILVEHAVHFIDVVNGCTEASLERVDGWTSWRNPGQQDRVMATMTYSDGLLATHYHAFSRPGFFEDTSMRFVFDLAQFDVKGWIPLTGRVSALLRSDGESSLRCLPGLDLRLRPVGAVPDASRTEGWGTEEGSSRRVVRSGGRTYEVKAHADGTFALPVSKSQAYADALRALLTDVLLKIDNPVHRLRVGLVDAVDSLDAALQARREAHRTVRQP